MPTLNFGQIKRRIMLRTGGRIDAIRAGELMKDKLTEIAESYSWSWLKAESLLSTVAPKSGGTVTLNVDTTKIDGTSTSFASTDVGSYIRVAQDVAFYKVTAVSSQQLTLETAYVGSTFSTQSYSLFRHIYSLQSDFRRFVSPAFWPRLQEATLGQLDEWDALRSQSDLPSHYAYRGVNSAGVMQVEIWPVPSAAVGIRYSYLKTIPEPSLDTTTIPLRPDVLIYSCAADALYTLVAESTKPQEVQHLAGLAQQYDAKGLQALQEERYSDSAIAGVPRGVRDYRQGQVWNDTFLSDHDSGVF